MIIFSLSFCDRSFLFWELNDQQHLSTFKTWCLTFHFDQAYSGLVYPEPSLLLPPTTLQLCVT